MVRYCFKNSYEECVVKLHEQLKAGKAAIVDGYLSTELVKGAVDLLVKDSYSISGRDAGKSRGSSSTSSP